MKTTANLNEIQRQVNEAMYEAALRVLSLHPVTMHDAFNVSDSPREKGVTIPKHTTGVLLNYTLTV